MAIGMVAAAKALGKAMAKYGKTKALIKLGVPNVVRRHMLNPKKSKGFKNIIKWFGKHTLKRAVPIINYVEALNNHGWLGLLKRYALNNFLPEDIRKMYYFFSSCKQGYKKTIKEDTQKFFANPSIDDQTKIAFLENAMQGITENQLKVYWNIWIEFTVLSPQTHNFDREVHFYNAYKKEMAVPIRSGGSGYTNSYIYTNIDYNLVVLAMLKLDYGVVIFSQIRRD